VTPRLDGGGVEAVTLDVARAVAMAGAGSLVASRGGALEPQLRASGARLLSLPVHAKTPWTILANAVRLSGLIRREAVSLVHVRSRAPAFSALIAGRLAGVPVIATYHGVYSARSALKRWYNAVMTRGEITIANSEFTRRHVLARHHAAPERVVVIAEGVDTDVFDPAQVSAARIAAVRSAFGLASDEQRPVVLLAARLTGWKGQGFAIETFAALARSDALLIVAGRAESAAFARSLAAMADAAGVADRVRFVGPLADMPAAYRAADVVIAPSLEPESFGRSVAEACAMERLVLASNLGAVAETIEDGRTGWLLPPGDPRAWSAAIARALDLDPHERDAVGRAARRRIVERYSLKAMCAATFALYRQVTERRR
jgi:glycosyltransferase involved in cell wall biosynthesis